MNLIKKQGGLLLLAILLIVLMYQFPKSVVENEVTKNKVVENTSMEAAVNLLEGDNPMEGIFMLRDIVLKNPKHTQASENESERWGAAKRSAAIPLGEAISETKACFPNFAL